MTFNENCGASVIERAGQILVFACAGAAFSVADILDAAFWRGALADGWHKTLLGAAALDLAEREGLEPDLDAVQARSEEFRYERDLGPAEDTERWLADRALTSDDFSDFFLRAYWRERLGQSAAPTALDYAMSTPDRRELARIDCWLSGELERLAFQQAWREAALASLSPGSPSAAAREAVRARWSLRRGWEEREVLARLSALHRSSDWCAQLVAAEAAHETCCAAALTTANRERALMRLRDSLLRLDCEIIDLESEDTAREAFWCVCDDGVSMQELAREARYPFQRCRIRPEEVPPAIGERLSRARPGTVLEPWPRGEGYQLCRVCDRIEPDLADAAVRLAVDEEIVRCRGEEMMATRIRWLLEPPAHA